MILSVLVMLISINFMIILLVFLTVNTSTIAGQEIQNLPKSIDSKL
jgi:hypothetical protein